MNTSKAFCVVAGWAAVGLLTAPLCAQTSGQTPVAADQSAPQASPQSEPQSAAAEAPDEIVVRGRRMSEIKSDLRIHVDDFIQQVVAPPAGRGYARWDGRVCIGVNNLEQTAAQYLVDRISRLAVLVGLTPGEPGCRPDVIIIFSADGKATAESLVDTQPTLFRSNGQSGIQRGIDALHEFAESDRPVRWWHVSLPVDARLGLPAVRVPGEELNPGIEGSHTVKVAGPSRIHSGIRDELKRVIIVVDGPKLHGKGTTWQQLGDYLAIVSLAQVDQDAAPASYDSILNLFNNPGAYSGLTDWDLSFVRSLYSYDQERTPALQRNELVNRMVMGEVDNAR